MDLLCEEPMRWDVADIMDGLSLRGSEGRKCLSFVDVMDGSVV